MSAPPAAEPRREERNQGNPFMGLLGRLGNTMQQIAKEVRMSCVLSSSAKRICSVAMSAIAMPAIAMQQLHLGSIMVTSWMLGTLALSCGYNVSPCFKKRVVLWQSTLTAEG